MNSFALLSLYRSLTRHKLYAVLSLASLSLGIAVFVTLSLYVRFETSYETWLPKHRKIYLVEEYWDQPGSPTNGFSVGTMGGLVDQLRQDFPGIVGTRVQNMDANVIQNGFGVTERFAYVDSNLLDVISLPMVRGDGRAALRDPSAILLSETLARKYFPDGHAEGQTLVLSIMGKTALYRVGGVFRDLPKKTELSFAILGQIPAVPTDPMWFHWGSEHVQTYLRFDTPDGAKRLEGHLRAFVDRRAAKDQGPEMIKQLSLFLTPISDIHLQTPGRKLTVTTLGLVGLFTLLIAIVNYVNLATARSALRAREVAMRKVLGADRGALFRQFLGEAVLMVALAALIGLIVTELSLPFINAAGGLTLTVPYASVMLPMLMLVMGAGLIAGVYPALVLSRFPAAAVLASAQTPGGGRAGTRVREALVVVQFAFAIAFMVCTAVLFAQTRHVRNNDLGFNRDGLVIIGSTSDGALGKAQMGLLLKQIQRLPGVQSVTTSDSVPGYNSGNSTTVMVPGRPGDGPNLQWIRTGPAFFGTYGFRLLAGRWPDVAHRLDDIRNVSSNSDVANIVVNRRAADLLGFASPEAVIGKTVGGDTPRTIIGVVENARFFSPRDPVNGTVYYFMSDRTTDPQTAIRVSGNASDFVDTLRAVWRKIAPQIPFSAATASQNLQPYYDADDQAARLFGIGAALAVLIGCFGIWGLASFSTARRVKEIGIRKTLGASSTNIMFLLVGQYLRPVLVANIIAWLLAFIAMSIWLAGFDDHIALSPLYFFCAGLLATVIAMLTVLGQSLRASRAAPAWALRHD